LTSETKFKETEIGMIPEDWELLTVDDIKSKEKKSVISGPFGSNISKKYFVESGIPVIRGNNLTTDMKRFVEEGFVFVTPEKADELNTWALRNDIVFTAAGTLGQVGIIENNSKFEKYIISNKQLRLRVNEKKVCPLYAFYWFSSPEMTKRIVNYNTGSTIPLINLSVLKKLPIVVPSLKIQDSIVYILDSLDQKIELNYQMSKTLEQIAQTLFKHWFIDFEFPDENGNPYKSSGGRMVDSELGGIPEGWRVGSILDFADLLSGGTPKTSVSEYWDGGVPWVSAKDVTSSNGTFILTTEKTITQKGIEKSNAKLLPMFTTVVTARGTVGNVCILSTEMAINQTNYGLKSKYDYGDFFLFLTVLNLIQDMKQNAYGTVFDTITTKTFRQIQTILPSTSAIKSFENIIYSFKHKILSNLEESQNLSSIRDSLLPKLMSGKIRVEC